jgi:glycerophosphoryl diester phosphodiesterase
MEVVGHGGAGDFFPGNSRQSIEKALAIGVDRIEIDVQLGTANQLVLVHDDEVRIDGKRMRVRKLGVEQLRQSLDGFLTLDEAIELIGDKASVMIDMKSRGYEQEIADSVRKYDLAASTIVSSTYAWSLRTVKRNLPGLAIGLSTGHISTVMRRNKLISVTSGVLAAITPLPLIGAAKLIDADHLMLNYRICTARFVRLAHRHGLSVYAWTVNHPRPIGKLIDSGVDGLISNRPDLVLEALSPSGTAVPIIGLP